jgi:glycosyltransferase involved in cell wall biosynthesis
MKNSEQHWSRLYNQVPLCDMPRHYAGIADSPFMIQYLQTVLRLCPSGGRTLETGVGSGTSAIWLSKRGCHAEGLDYAPEIVERARQINNLLEGKAQFREGDLFGLYPSNKADGQRDNASPNADPPYHVIHHQGVLEHFTVPQIRAALAQQVALARHVVFSVPSVYYPFDPEFGDERLLPLEEWERILAPFDIVELKYYGDPQYGEREHVLGVLCGQSVTPALEAMMHPLENPYRPGISAIVHTRDEASRIEECLQSLQGWTDEIIVCDMESGDATVEIASRYTQEIVRHPLIAHFDRARNVSAMRARHQWVFYLDADERVPPALGAALKALVEKQTSQEPSEAGRGHADQDHEKKEAVSTEESEFDGLLIPFRHHFAGHWMRCLYPGYTMPRLFRNGRFHFPARHHAGPSVEGKTACFPADNPDLALVHYSYDSLGHYLDKLNRYTDGEAQSMHRSGQSFHWQGAIRHWVGDFASYYDKQNARQDGVHGLIYSFLSAFYRFEQHAKLYEQRFHAGQLQPPETGVPASVEEVLEYALAVLREKPLASPRAISVEANNEQADIVQTTRVQATADPTTPNTIAPNTIAPLAIESAETRAATSVPVVWSGPLLDPSGYGEESRQFLLGLDELCDEKGNATDEPRNGTDGPNSGVHLAAQMLPWSHDTVDLEAREQERLERLSRQAVPPGFIHITQNFPPGIVPHSQAAVSIGRTMFETDRLPLDWVKSCNRLDYVWVPTEFNRRSFAAAGVWPEKLRVVPGCLDARLYREEGQAFADTLRERQKPKMTTAEPFTFLTVFDWTRHKGWDALLRAFLRAFEGREDVALVLKVWSTMGYGAEGIRQQAAALVRDELGHNLTGDPRIRFRFDRLPAPELRALYRDADAFVLPSRGEGWGRPYMEAMACALPTIGTGWSGNTAFMNAENSYLVRNQVVPVPESGWREIPTYQGHRWAEPEESHLIELMQRVVEERSEAHTVGRQAHDEILQRFDRRNVARQIRAELEQVWEQHRLNIRGLVTNQNTSPALCNAQPLIPTEALATGGSSSPALSESVAPEVAPTVRVRWEGAQFCWHSLGHVNRELCLGLLDDPGIEVSLVPTEPAWFTAAEDPRFAILEERFFAPLSSPADVHIRHFFPPRFQKPEEGRLVLIQPWEYGYLPTAWIEPIVHHVDEVWCYSQYVKEVYLRSGIPEAKLQVVPLGVDTEVFHPQALPYVFTNEAGAGRLVEAAKLVKGRRSQSSANAETGVDEAGKAGPFVFLFTGGTLHRKGIDILLEAYFKAFTALDNVCLVIKDTGADTVYRGGNERERILELIAAGESQDSNSSNRPPLVYLDRDLSSHQLAGLYTAADCLVQPYRGEGFCLPALEAMACGLPVIVPEGGPTDDFVDESVGWQLRAEKKPFSILPCGPSGEERGRIGQWDCCGPTWMLEVDPDELARRLRHIAARPEEARAKGHVAALQVRESWTWRQAANTVASRLRALTQRTDSTPAQPALSGASGGGAEYSGVMADAPENCVAPAQKLNNGSYGPRAEAEAEVAISMTRPEPKISLCMIARDEERVLGDCLQSARPYVDEIILVDTGSVDRTVEIAKEHGARVFHFPWCDDFSAARNASIRYATEDWIFWMDADDTLPAQCGAKLKPLVELAEEATTGFLMQVHIPPAPGEEGFTIVDHLKLFRNLPGLRFEGRIHEQILEPLYRLGGKAERTDLYVVHSGYEYPPAGQTKKRARDILLLQKDLEERPGHPFVLFNIGMTAHHLKEWDKAVDALEECLRRSKPFESIVRKAYAMLAGSYLAKGDVAGAVERIGTGLALFPHDPELLFRAGIVYREAGELRQAEESYVKLLTNREVGHIDSLDVSMTGFKAHHNLALIYQDLNRWEEAEHHFQVAVRNNPSFTPSWIGLSDLLVRRNKIDELKVLECEASARNPQAADLMSRSLKLVK